jgi:hypothetical protein
LLRTASSVGGAPLAAPLNSSAAAPWMMRNRSGMFSIERLMAFLTALGQDVEITSAPRASGRERRAAAARATGSWSRTADDLPVGGVGLGRPGRGIVALPPQVSDSI